MGVYAVVNTDTGIYLVCVLERIDQSQTFFHRVISVFILFCYFYAFGEILG